MRSCEEIEEPLLRELCHAILSASRCFGDVGLSFSGGLDSGFLAYLLRDMCRVTLYTVGVTGSTDIKNAAEIATLLKMPLTIITVDEAEVVKGIRFLREIDPAITPLEASFELPLYFVVKNSTQKAIFTGQGADELFGGYHKYLQQPERMNEDFKILLSITLPRERKIAERFGKILHTPYLHPDVVQIAQNMELERKIKDGVRKKVLRDLSRELGAPELLWKREKKAAQYGSGIWKLIRKMSKKRGMSVDKFILTL